MIITREPSNRFFPRGAFFATLTRGRPCRIPACASLSLSLSLPLSLSAFSSFLEAVFPQEKASSFTLRRCNEKGNNKTHRQEGKQQRRTPAQQRQGRRQRRRPSLSLSFLLRHKHTRTLSLSLSLSPYRGDDSPSLTRPHKESTHTARCLPPQPQAPPPSSPSFFSFRPSWSRV